MVTARFAGGTEENFDTSNLIAYGLLSIVGIYMLTPILFLAFTHKLIMGDATVLRFALLELIIVSYFIVWELVNFRLYLEFGYDKDILVWGSESADEEKSGLDKLSYT